MEDLEKKIRDRLIWDNRIDDSQIEIAINKKNVILKGCVSTYPEKILAEIEAQLIPEVKSVINNIDVILQEDYSILLDEKVENTMYCLLDANSEINSNDVKVSIHDGSVKLKGRVNSYWKKDKIEKMASDIRGVKSVKNEVTIVPSEVTSDEQIYNYLIDAMRDSVHIDVTKLDIKVDIGIVTLSGTISSLSEYDAIVNIVKSTKGVVGIIDNLKWILRYQTT